jgi:hypothetical protein
LEQIIHYFQAVSVLEADIGQLQALQKMVQLQVDVVGELIVEMADLLVEHLHLESDPSAS